MRISNFALFPFLLGALETATDAARVGTRRAQAAADEADSAVASPELIAEDKYGIILPGGTEVEKKCTGNKKFKLDDDGEDLMWIMDDKHDIDLTCATARPNSDPSKSGKVFGNLCDEGNDAQRWEIRQVDGFAFQIRTQSEDASFNNKLCVAVRECENEANLVMVDCDSCDGGPPDPKTLWYTSNIGTINSYYCSFTAIFGMYYITPRSTNGPSGGLWKISDTGIGASTEGDVSSDEQVVGMHFFWQGLPNPTPGYCGSEGGKKKQSDQTCQDAPESLPWTDNFERNAMNKIAPWTTTSKLNTGILDTSNESGCGDFSQGDKSMYIYSGRTAVTSPVIDTSDAGDLWVQAWVKKGADGCSRSEDPTGAREDLSFSYRNKYGRWILLRGYGGQTSCGGPAGQVFFEKFNLSNDAASEEFQLRFTFRNGDKFADYWHIDSIEVSESEPSGATTQQTVGEDTRCLDQLAPSVSEDSM